MKALASPHTRLPLYRGDQEEIVGILHAKDLLRVIAAQGGDLDNLDISEILRQPWFVPGNDSGAGPARPVPANAQPFRACGR